MASALIVCPEAPYPVAGGGPLRTACILEYLARKYTLDVIAFREPGTPDPREAFPPGLSRSIRIIDLPYHSKTTVARAARNLGRLVRGVPPLVDRFDGFQLPIEHDYEVAVIEHFWCAPYVHQVKRRARRVVLDLHNIESVLLSRSADADPSISRWALRRFAANCHHLEKELLPAFDALLVTSESDRRSLGTGIVIPNTLPVIARPSVAKRDEIVFSGNMAYLPNTVAAHWFASNVWPILRNRYPDLTWRLVGKNPESLRLPNHPGMDVIGPVDNAVSAIASARVAVVPILSGSGTRFKILEAWAAGVPVVSTPIGAEGLEAVPGEHLLLAKKPEDFADTITSVVNDHSLAERLARSGRTLYEEKYTWQVAWKMLEEAGL